MGVVMLPARRVAYTASFGDPSTSDAFVRLEQVVPLKGNRFYATFDPRRRSTARASRCATVRQARRTDCRSLRSTAERMRAPR
jgi:hypothetical protein